MQAQETSRGKRQARTEENQIYSRVKEHWGRGSGHVISMIIASQRGRIFERVNKITGLHQLYTRSPQDLLFWNQNQNIIPPKYLEIIIYTVCFDYICFEKCGLERHLFSNWQCGKLWCRPHLFHCICLKTTSISIFLKQFVKTLTEYLQFKYKYTLQFGL